VTEHVLPGQVRSATAHLGEYDERLQVADDEAGEKHEAELATGRLDDRSLEVLKKCGDDCYSGSDAENGHGGRHDSKRTVPAHVLLTLAASVELRHQNQIKSNQKVKITDGDVSARNTTRAPDNIQTL